MPFVRFIGFSVIRAWQGFWRNAMMSLAATATVILMLVLLAALAIVIAGLNSGLEFIESKVAVTARLVDDLPRADRLALIDEVERYPDVASVEYVSPQEAMERLRDSYREQGQELDLGGADSTITLFASLEISPSDPNASSAIANRLSDSPHVVRILTKQAEYDTLLGVINLIRTIGLVAVGLVALTVLFMIINTIRIAVYSRANEIEIMRLVGASDSFIRWPFILEGILCGLIGAIITIVLVATIWGPIQPIMVSVFQMPTAVSTQFLTTISLLLFAVGLGVGAVGSWISVRSYLAAAG
ncbi:MAG TPA: permease-like cell division protein FtsX [Candidatus Limnocylindrales bacterium]|jgi:cell division transport system permease protein|nr:permease-like cell division protein FtsX [Candidatus Limnocylindrales bacterium]